MADSENKCDVCGQTDFVVKEGYYFCSECGTQSQHVRDFEIDQAGMEQSQAFFTSFKIGKEKAEKDQLTSWECFNYILRGLVEELLQLGAKEELKLTVLQLWSAYLRKCEVAFFSTRSAELPKLGPKFAERDARIVYNHKKVLVKRKRKSTATNQQRKWTQLKRKHAKAEYESMSESASAQSSSQQSSSSCASNRAIPLQFSRIGRRYYKRYMPAKHLNRHQTDSASELECHKLSANNFHGALTGPERLTRKTVYGIIYLALNLIQDDIQLCDILRFCREGHLSTSKLANFFPEEIAKDCTKLITMQNFYGWTHFHSTKIRIVASHLARFIHIPDLKLPNLVKMAKRFIADLSLPPDLGVYVERLYNLHPSQMQYRFSDPQTPCYEGRAMAYVVFVLKLLFVLDGEAELTISNSAKTINAELKRIGREDKMLFVWEDWVRYIEMRKVILTQCHYPTSYNLKENISYDQYVDHLREAYETPYEDVVNSKRTVLLSMEKIFDDLHTKLRQKNPKEKIPLLKCPASLTPYTSYLRYILEDKTFAERLFIPSYIYDEPATKDIKPFVHAKELKALFNEHNVEFIVKKIGTTCSRNNLGVFCASPFIFRNRTMAKIRLCKVDFDVDEVEWVEKLKRTTQPPDIFTRTDNDFKVPKRPKSTKKPRTDFRELVINKDVQRVATDAATVHSFDVFSEDNMEPLAENVVNDVPRQFETESVLTNLSDEEDEGMQASSGQQQLPQQSEVPESEFRRKVELKVSNFDCWNFNGVNKYFHIDEIERVEKKLPKIFYWLLKTCAEIAEIDIIRLYQELLAIETEFLYALEPLDNFQDILSYRGRVHDRETQRIVDYYKGIW